MLLRVVEVYYGRSMSRGLMVLGLIHVYDAVNFKGGQTFLGFVDCYNVLVGNRSILFYESKHFRNYIPLLRRPVYRSRSIKPFFQQDLYHACGHRSSVAFSFDFPKHLSPFVTWYTSYEYDDIRLNSRLVLFHA